MPVKVTETVSTVLPKASNKLASVPELKRAITFAEALNDILNNSEQAIQINSAPDSVFKPREDLIKALSIDPFVCRCKKCGRVIESGDYCSECAKELATRAYVLSDVNVKNTDSCTARALTEKDTLEQILLNIKNILKLQRYNDKEEVK